ncbi:MAG: hypothetical protein FJ390_07880 [Verrucomicrobia bacterium]|nr:hypothetical protein [Verrucomicrobiota bacterium]
MEDILSGENNLNSMKLIDLVAYFRHGGTFENFCRTNGLNPESEVIEIYAQEPVGLESQLGFFPIEETKGRAEFLSDGIKYHTLFDFYYFLDAIEDVISKKIILKDSELAQTLLSYALKDA